MNKSWFSEKGVIQKIPLSYEAVLDPAHTDIFYQLVFTKAGSRHRLIKFFELPK